ncbi:hypothetical protein G7076_02545 [Sphingomonas sp. HDW15A]|uniref:hypothetical protein n=1 Tax=Sphingomonas sp. HDW15A TaxID=2714942 RepID=UPI001408F046|nr:hypothetical protein [Sphingomonas sp. HDW15A]QIK95510.1 hypothetical protein G7076_02545 [Sphingomonas sp. HDW15A]
MTRVKLDPRRLCAKQSRAKRLGSDDFLYRRAIEDCLDRLQFLPGPVGDLVILEGPGKQEDGPVVPGAASVVSLALSSLEPGCADLVLAVGVLDYADDPAIAAFITRHALRPGGRLIGASIGSGSLPRMRRAFLDAERASGRAAQRFHAMLDAATLSEMLSGAGFTDVVVDVDSFDVRYSGLDSIVRDLRSMGCTNSLAGAIPALDRGVYRDARNLFSSGERVEERFEILHFSGIAKMTV